jgi:glutathione reductase (NADPH)
MHDVDLFVIGGGSGGVRAARIAASHGARVAIAEARTWGGTCVGRGCIPKKLFVYGSEIAAQLADARGYGWTITATHDWPTLVDAVAREVDRLVGRYDANLARHGVVRYEARAQLTDPHTIVVGAHTVTAGHVLIATGGRPRALPVPGAERAISSDDFFKLRARPARTVVLGGGYIAVELAHVLAGLGSQVTVAHRGAKVLPGFDDDLRTHLEDGLRRAGIEVRGGVEATALTAATDDPAATTVQLTDGTAVTGDVVLAAIGRDPNTAGLGLDTAGVALGKRGAILVDETSRTSAPHIYAVGDVTGRAALTPVAIREGHAFADSVFGNTPTIVRHELVPTAIFAHPPGATVGLTEAAARAAGHDVEIRSTDFKPLRHTVSGRDERTLIKLVLDRTTRRVLGVHMVGADAPEIIQVAAIALTMGATIEDFRRTIAVHPTAAEELVLL